METFKAGVQRGNDDKLVPQFTDWRSGEDFELCLVFPPTRYVPERVRALSLFLQQKLAALDLA
jgi:DNA-binding transcriptional LysR family regulator